MNPTALEQEPRTASRFSRVAVAKFSDSSVFNFLVSKVAVDQHKGSVCSNFVSGNKVENELRAPSDDLITATLEKRAGGQKEKRP